MPSSKTPLTYPWDLSPSQLDTISEASDNEQGLLKEALIYSNRSAFRVPFVAACVIWGAVALVLLIMFLNRIIHFFLRPFFLRRTKTTPLSRLFVNQLLEAPLFKTRRANNFEVLNKAIIVRFPGRLHAIAIVALVATNLITLFAFQEPFGKEVEDIGPPAKQYATVTYKRSCMLLMAQLPILFALAGRNSPMAIISGASFNSMMLYHRWFARVITMHAIIHASVITWNKLQSGTSSLMSMYAYPFVIWGVVGVTLFALICFMATVPIRNFSYEFFLISHIVMIIVTIVAVWNHLGQQGTARYSWFYYMLEASIVLWAVERIWRTLRVVFMNLGRNYFPGHEYSTWLNRFCTHTVCRALPDGAVHVRLYLAGFMARNLLLAKPGQHVYVNIPSIQPLSMHPFSVITTGLETVSGDAIDTVAATPPQPYLDLAMMPQHGFTRQVVNRVKASEANMISALAFVEGPYGHPVNTRGYSSVAIFAGGIGITHCIACLMRSLRDYDAWDLGAPNSSSISNLGQKPVRQAGQRKVVLVWSIRDPSSFVLLLPYVRAALEERAREFPHPISDLEIKVFITTRWKRDPEKNPSVMPLLPDVNTTTTTLPPSRAGLYGDPIKPQPSQATDLDTREVLADSQHVSPINTTSNGLQSGSSATLHQPEGTEVLSSFPGDSRTVNSGQSTTVLASSEADQAQADVIAAIIGDSDKVKDDLTFVRAHANLEFFIGKRPNFESELRLATEVPGRCFITSCGATPFSDSVRRAVRQVRQTTHRTMDFHDESFSW